MFKTALVPFWNIFCFLRLLFQAICGLVMELLMLNISRIFNIFTRKNKRCYVSFHIPHIWLSLSKGHQRVWIKWFVTLESEARTYSIAKENATFFVVKMFRLLVIPFIIKLYRRVSIFTKYCILVCQNFLPSKISCYTPVMKW